ncbi:hypothetical protein BpHYR1_037218, partial [Brachionus plicatilis]
FSRLIIKLKIIYVKKNFFKSRILTFQYTLIVRLYSSSRLLRSSQLVTDYKSENIEAFLEGKFYIFFSSLCLDLSLGLLSNSAQNSRKIAMLGNF